LPTQVAYFKALETFGRFSWKLPIFGVWRLI